MLSPFEYLDWLILGQFKFALEGAFLALFALALTALLSRWIKPAWARVLIGAVLVGLCLWYGHLLIDPQLHAVEAWYVTPLAPHMVITK